MKKNVCIFALSTLLGVTAAFAAPQAVSAPPASQTQTAPSNTARPAAHAQVDPNRQVARLTKRLQLTSDQQAQILPILTSQVEQAKRIRADASLSKADRHAKMQELRQNSDSQIKNVLTDPQKQQYDALKQQARAHARAQRNNGNTASAS